jgi:hypothetical protein
VEVESATSAEKVVAGAIDDEHHPGPLLVDGIAEQPILAIVGVE